MYYPVGAFIDVGVAAFVAVAAEVPASGGQCASAISVPDGSTWEIAGFTDLNAVNALVYGNGLFVLGGDGPAGKQRIQTSVDGLTWTIRFDEVHNALNAGAYSAALGLFVLVGQQSAGKYTSTDGITWTFSAETTPTRLHELHWAAELGLFLMPPDQQTGSRNTFTSPDGFVWTEHVNAIPVNRQFQSSAWNGTIFCAACAQQVFAGHSDTLTSTDGISWTQHVNALPTQGEWNGMIWVPSWGKFACFRSGSTEAATSSDGITWTSQTMATTQTWLWGAQNGVVAAVISNTEKVGISSNGTTWSTVTIPQLGGGAAYRRVAAIPAGG